MIKRIDLEGTGFTEWVYADKEEMRLNLCSLHAPDCTGTEINSNGEEVYKDIFTLTFQEICEYGNWGYEEVSEEEYVEDDWGLAIHDDLKGE